VRLIELIKVLIGERQAGGDPGGWTTLLAVCPNSAAVMEAAVKVAAMNHCPMLFAATLNQVDRDGGYTLWTPSSFSAALKACASQYHWDGPLVACLDHGGPWLKDRHTLDGLSFEQTMAEVKLSLSACLEAGYELLHIDPTVDRRLLPGTPPEVDAVVSRTVELIAYAEAERQRMGLPLVVYEVGTEEVQGGLVDFDRFQRFLSLLRDQLNGHGLKDAWPGFIVAQVGTHLHTTSFDFEVAKKLSNLVTGFGSLVKGHYTDWVDRAEAYPLAGLGGANVGPEFTSAEYLALKELEMKEKALSMPLTSAARHPIQGEGQYQPEFTTLNRSEFMAILTQAVVSSDRWKKWLQPGEKDVSFPELNPSRQEWLVQTGARYVWTEPSVVAAREKLYTNLQPVYVNPHSYVVDRIADSIDHYINRFNLFDFNRRLGNL
jgi:D-tagatose-1,6-bisphosphate aldolase subunit GatZ/KbaZ